MTPPRDQIGPDLAGFVWRHSARDQIGILIVTLLGMPLLYLSLELPKRIINEAIGGSAFPRTVLGVDLGQIDYLVLLCALFLATVIAHNGVKWVTNIAAGMTGERLLRRLRYSLFEQTLRFPPHRLAATRPAEVVQAMMAEVEPLGGFFGEVVATPMSQGGMLLVFVGFIFVQDPLLGLAATATLPVQAVLIPWLQRRVVALNRERAANNRRLADTVASTLDGQAEMRLHGVQRWHLAQVSARLHSNTVVRKALFRRKFTIKFIANLLNQLTPFLFFLIGGAMVIEGRLDLGALVAVLAAYKDLGKPWRELLGFYQRWSDFRSRYGVVVESFSGDDLMAAARLNAAPTQPPPGGLETAGLTVDVGHQTIALPPVSLPPGGLLALKDGSAATRVAVLRAMAGLAPPHEGAISLGGVDLAALKPADLGATLGLTGPSAVILNGSMAENMAYGLHREAPPLAADRRPDAAVFQAEARRTGAPIVDAGGDWTDYRAAGCGDRDSFRARMVAVCESVGMGNDLLAAALRLPFGQLPSAALRQALLDARPRMASALRGRSLDDLVETFDPDALGANLSLIETILFAVPAATGVSAVALLDDPAVARLLARSEAGALLADIGADLARSFAGLAASVSSDSPLLDRLGSYGRADVLLAASLAPGLPPEGRAVRSGLVRRQIVALAARYTPVRDRLDLLDEARRAAILAVRRSLAPSVAAVPALASLTAAQPPGSLTLAETLLGGRRREDRRAGWRRLDAAMTEVIAQEGFRGRLLDVGLDAPLDAAPGSEARARLSLVRTILKRPRLVLLEGATPDADLAALALVRSHLPEAMVLTSADDGAILGQADIVGSLDEDGARITLERGPKGAMP